MFFMLGFAIGTAQAQTFTVLYSFGGGADGANPLAGLTLDAQGNLYGTTYYGGYVDPAMCYYGCGTAFKLDTMGKKTNLYTFTGLDGANPAAALTMDAHGNLYGTTEFGGRACSEGGCGTIFRLSPQGHEVVVHSFNGRDGGAPAAELRINPDGNAYGTTTLGGDLKCSKPPEGCGTVFKVDRTGNYEVLHSFHRGTSDGHFPFGAAILHSGQNIYVTTADGGRHGFGTIFELGKTGTELRHYSFTGGTDGASPYAGLTADSEGNFYGTTYEGGDMSCAMGNNRGCGVVFKIDQKGNETVLHSFGGSPDGYQPLAPLVRDSAGNLYGTTYYGGIFGSGCGFGCGTVFKIDTAGNETILYSFTGGEDGGNPQAGLFLDKDGNMYGTTLRGGNPACTYPYAGCGTVYKITIN
jgi:uncharacterized repeat protein (TIGR03803 family)